MKIRGDKDVLREFLDSLMPGEITQLADEVHLSATYLHRMASGDRPITIDKGLPICRSTFAADRLPFRKLFPNAPLNVDATRGAA